LASSRWAGVAPRHHTRTSSTCTGRPTFDHGENRFSAGSDDGSVDAYDAGGCGSTACNPLWSTTTGSRITGAPAVAAGKLVVGTADGRLISYGLP
jgi:outer membrane protein assembly factor BamB